MFPISLFLYDDHYLLVYKFEVQAQGILWDEEFVRMCNLFFFTFDGPVSVRCYRSLHSQSNFKKY